MKKNSILFVAILSLTLALALTGCGSAETKAPLTKGEAIAAVFAATEVSLPQDTADSTAEAPAVDAVEVIETEQGEIFEVILVIDGVEQRFTVNLTKGDSVRVVKDGKTLYTGEKTKAPEGKLSSEDAEDIALAHAGVVREDAVFDRSELDFEKGCLVYEVEFISAGREYDYEIDAESGKIVTFKQKGERQDSADYIGKDKALAIALADAGLSEAEVTRVKVEADVEKGMTVYEVEFKNGAWEYDYEIDAVSGNILKEEKERD